MRLFHHVNESSCPLRWRPTHLTNGLLGKLACISALFKHNGWKAGRCLSDHLDCARIVMCMCTMVGAPVRSLMRPQSSMTNRHGFSIFTWAKLRVPPRHHPRFPGVFLFGARSAAGVDPESSQFSEESQLRPSQIQTNSPCQGDEEPSCALCLAFHLFLLFSIIPNHQPAIRGTSNNT